MRGKKSDMPVTSQNPGIQTHEVQWGEMASSIDTFSKGYDFASSLKGLPDDACQCPHWGYLTRGRMTVRYTDGSEETINQGDAFYMKPGHVPHIDDEMEWIIFSPADKLRITREHISRTSQGRGERAA